MLSILAQAGTGEHEVGPGWNSRWRDLRLRPGQGRRSSGADRNIGDFRRWKDRDAYGPLPESPALVPGFCS
jgi:hypothetical protein